jgi:hypothetical protein
MVSLNFHFRKFYISDDLMYESLEEMEAIAATTTQQVNF